MRTAGAMVDSSVEMVSRFVESVESVVDVSVLLESREDLMVCSTGL